MQIDSRRTAEGHKRYPTRVAGLLVGALLLSATACAAHTDTVTLKSVGADPTATSSTATGSTAAGPGAPSTSQDQTSAAAVATTTTLDPLAAASPALTAALEAYGHSPAYAACVITQIGQQFTGTRLAFAIAVLSLKNAADQQLQAAIAATGISDTDKADMPDAIHGIYDTCASTEHATG